MIERAWFERHPVRVAFDLLGATIEVTRDGEMTGGRITETEAYAGPEDLASHAGRLRAGRVALFGEVGRLYMYRSYGIHTMANVVAHEPGKAGAVLIRAIEPLEGLEAMCLRRGVDDLRKLANGPGVLCQALGLRLDDDGYDLVDRLQETSVRIEVRPGSSPAEVIAGPRIGITRAIDHRWRCFDASSSFVSSHRRGVVVTRDMLEDIIADGLPEGRGD